LASHPFPPTSRACEGEARVKQQKHHQADVCRINAAPAVWHVVDVQLRAAFFELAPRGIATTLASIIYTSAPAALKTGRPAQAAAQNTSQRRAKHNASTRARSLNVGVLPTGMARGWGRGLPLIFRFYCVFLFIFSALCNKESVFYFWLGRRIESSALSQRRDSYYYGGFYIHTNY
jgi:hypothetical protein